MIYIILVLFGSLNYLAAIEILTGHDVKELPIWYILPALALIVIISGVVHMRIPELLIPYDLAKEVDCPGLAFTHVKVWLWSAFHNMSLALINDISELDLNLRVLFYFGLHVIFPGYILYRDYQRYDRSFYLNQKPN